LDFIKGERASAVDLNSIVTVKKYSEADADNWDGFVRRAAGASFCHQSGWIRVVERVWGHRSHSIYAEQDGRVVGVLPVFHVANSPLGAPFGARLVSTPNAVYGGVVAEGEDVRGLLIDAAKSLAGKLRVDYLELRGARGVDPSPPVWRRQNLYVTFERPITKDEDALMKSFPRDVRRMIRLGSKFGLSSQLGREELLDDFYAAYAASLRRLGTPAFPKRLFAEFLREFPGASDILLIRQGGRVAGAVMSFYFRGAVAPYYGGAYPEFHGAGVNNFMYWELMCSAARRGHSSFDFGRSKRGSGSYEFKRGWGMTETALPYAFLLLGAKRMPELNPMNPKFKLMIETWKRLPLGFTKLIGPMIVKYLP
jgi:FemAB-related protein (PEP-CTERM system-associated)